MKNLSLHPTSSFWPAISIQFHVDNPTNTEARNLLDLLDSAGLQQHVDGPTQCDGHALELTIPRCVDNFISKLKILPELPSDHKRLLCNVDFPRLAPTRKNVTYCSDEHVS